MISSQLCSSRIFQVELLLRQPFLGLSYLPIFQSVLYCNGDLARHLRKEHDISLAEGILLPSAEAQKTENAIPTNKWHHATGFDAGHLKLWWSCGICCHRRDDPMVRAVDQIVQIAGGDGPEYG
jgi:hypothetical protein